MSHNINTLLSYKYSSLGFRTDGNKKKRKLSIEADLGAARKKKEKRETLAQS